MRIVLAPPLISPTATPVINRSQLAGLTKVVVNVFDGGERNDVRMSVDNGRYKRMRQVLRVDPYIEALFIR